MNAQQFNQNIVKPQLEFLENLLVKKTEEYNLDEKDRFSDFKQGAGLTGETPEQVLFGYMLKHIVSVASMVSSGEIYTKERWNEKLTDIQIYSLLLRGLVEDTGRAS
jgi:hypothetical protein